jgi:hypothetical protein
MPSDMPRFMGSEKEEDSSSDEENFTAPENHNLVAVDSSKLEW